MRTHLAAIAAIAASLAVASPALASDSYPPVRVDLAFVAAYGPGDASTYGAGLSVEPKYAILDQLSAGLRIEALGMGTNGVTVSGQNVSVGARGVVAFLAKADYYLTTTSVRPFLAFGAGLYLVGSSSAQASATTAAVSTESFTGFGVCPQVGLNLGAFRLAAAYNVITGGDSTTATFGNVALPSKNYFSFDIGGTFGGARSSP